MNTGCSRIAQSIDDLFAERRTSQLDCGGRPIHAIEGETFDAVAVWADAWEDEGDYEVAAGLRLVALRRNLPQWAHPVAWWRLLPVNPDWSDIRHSLWPEEFAALCDSDQDPTTDSVVTYDCPTDALVALARVLSRRLAAIAEGVRNGKGR